MTCTIATRNLNIIEAQLEEINDSQVPLTKEELARYADVAARMLKLFGRMFECRILLRALDMTDQPEHPLLAALGDQGIQILDGDAAVRAIEAFMPLAVPAMNIRLDKHQRYGYGNPALDAVGTTESAPLRQFDKVGTSRDQIGDNPHRVRKITLGPNDPDYVAPIQAPAPTPMETRLDEIMKPDDPLNGRMPTVGEIRGLVNMEHRRIMGQESD